MKTKFLSLLLIAFISITVFTTSCKKEETKKSTDPTVGTWNAITESFTDFDSMGNLKRGDTVIYSLGELVLDFRENGMVIFTENYGSETDMDTSYYSINGISLNISNRPDMSDPITSTIQSLTSTDLNILLVDYGEDGEYSENRFSAKRQ